MKRFAHFAIVGSLVLAVLAAVAVACILLFVDPNKHKPEIETLVLEATGKPLSLQGDLSLSFFPGFSIEAGPAELHDDASFGSAPFAHIEKCRASVAILPLIKGKIEIGDVEIIGLRLKLAVNKAGKNNWTAPQNNDKERSAPAKQPSRNEKNEKKIEIADISLQSLTIKDALIVHNDMRSGTDTRLTLSKVALGPVAIGQKTSLALDASYKNEHSKLLSLSMNASFTLPASLSEGAHITAEGTFDATPFSLKCMAAFPKSQAGQEFSLKGDIALGAINLDNYTSAQTKTKSSGSAQKNAAPSSTQSVSHAATDNDTTRLLRQLSLDLHITADSVTVNKIPITDIKATIKGDQGFISAKPISMTIANGALAVEASIDAKGPTARNRMTGSWKNAHVGALLKAATGKSSLTGTLNVDWVLNASGLSWPAASQTLGGNVVMALTNGSLPAFQLIPKGVPGLPAKTLDISIVQSSATWRIANGTAENDDMSLKAVTLQATGKGTINIPAATINYRAAVELPTFRDLPDITVLPLVVSGSLSSPSYGVDQPRLLRQTARTILKPGEKAGEELQNIGKGLGDKLKRLKR